MMCNGFSVVRLTAQIMEHKQSKRSKKERTNKQTLNSNEKKKLAQSSSFYKKKIEFEYMNNFLLCLKKKHSRFIKVVVVVAVALRRIVLHDTHTTKFMYACAHTRMSFFF